MTRDRRQYQGPPGGSVSEFSATMDAFSHWWTESHGITRPKTCSTCRWPIVMAFMLPHAAAQHHSSRFTKQGAT